MENERLKKFGERLKILRKSKGLNQTEFAKLVNLTQAAISQFEEGKRIPSSTALEKIAVGLNSTIDELLGNSQEISGEPASPTDVEREIAIQALVANLKRKKPEAIFALNRFVEMQEDIEE
jgi:transcriptional regulator with XRE-family HTH domain